MKIYAILRETYINNYDLYSQDYLYFTNKEEQIRIIELIKGKYKSDKNYEMYDYNDSLEIYLKESIYSYSYNLLEYEYEIHDNIDEDSETFLKFI